MVVIAVEGGEAGGNIKGESEEERRSIKIIALAVSQEGTREGTQFREVCRD